MTIEQQLEVSGVADIIRDDAGFTDLKDLVNSDFDMDIDDQDYNLSMDELIKVAKILFHKINFNTKRIKLVLAESKHETDLRVA